MRLIARLACASLFLAVLGSAGAQSKTDNPCVKPASRLTTESWKKRHEMLQERTKNGGIDVLFVGDSITQGWESNGKKVWEEQFKAWKPGNIGIGGDQTQHVLWRITEGKEIAGCDPKVIVMMIGTNNFGSFSPEQVAEGVGAILAEFKKQKPNAKVLLLGVFPRSAKGMPKEATEVAAADLHPKVKATNDLIAKFADGKAVTYLDIGPSFLDDKGNLPRSIMNDFLHLTPAGYAKWAAAVKEPVEKLMK